MPKPVRPFPLISYYWEPSIGFRWKGTRYDILNGLLEGCEGDIYKMVRMARYVYFKSDLYDHCEDICRYGTLDQLRDMGVYAIRESLADEILNDLSYERYAP